MATPVRKPIPAGAFAFTESPAKGPTTSPFGQKSDANGYNTPKIDLQSGGSHTKGKPRGGWDDEDETNFVAKRTAGSGVKLPPSVNTGNKIMEISSQRSAEGKTPATSTTPSNNSEYEAKIISEIIQPGGPRTRQPDAVLNDFCRACDSLDFEVVGTILLDNIKAPIVWISKARAIYAIEALSKRFKKYFDFFKANLRKLRVHEFTEEGINASQLQKAMDDLINYLEEPTKPAVKAQPVTPNTAPVGGVSSQKTVPEQPHSAFATVNRKPIAPNSPDSNPESLNTQLKTQGANLTAGLPGSFKNKKAVVNSEPTSETLSAKPTVLDELAGLDFSGRDPHAENINEIYNQYQNVYPTGYNQPGYMGYPGPAPQGNFYPMPPQPVYYGQPQPGYPSHGPEFQAGYPQYPPQYNHAVNYPGPNMQPTGYPGSYPGGYPAPHGYPGMYPTQQAEQNSSPDLSPNKKPTPEEMQRLKQKEDLEMKFDNLKLLLK